jgi:oligopeptide/dipeptide ABC transporter ATP-binding protein
MPPLLQARSAGRVFGAGLGRPGKAAVEDFSMTIEGDPPSITALVGESGSGKTTIARMFLGLISPTSGEVLYRGKSLQRLTQEERRNFRRDVQIIFQDPFEIYNPFYKIDHLLAVPIAKFRLAPSRRERQSLMESVLREVGLDPGEILGRYPHQLSGGQRQRIAIARVLVIRPKLIIADEPVSMVDASLRASILATLQQLNRRFGISILYITHDLATAFQVSENMVVLYRGSVAEAGDVELVVQSPRHPYTQLLIDSIPQPDPGRAWGGADAPSPSTRAVGDMPTQGCKFADRCPHAMPACLPAPPPLFRTEKHRAAACILYRDAPVLQTADLDSIFVEARCVGPVGPASEDAQSQDTYSHN